MVLFSLLGSTMGFSVETLGFYALFMPLVAALGYDQFNYYGLSYGTELGQHVMKAAADHPNVLRSVILDSVVPPNVNFLSEIAASEDRVFGEVFAACAAGTLLWLVVAWPMQAPARR